MTLVLWTFSVHRASAEPTPGSRRTSNHEAKCPEKFPIANVLNQYRQFHFEEKYSLFDRPKRKPPTPSYPNRVNIDFRRRSRRSGAVDPPIVQARPELRDLRLSRRVRPKPWLSPLMTLYSPRLTPGITEHEKLTQRKSKRPIECFVCMPWLHALQLLHCWPENVHYTKRRVRIPLRLS